VTLKRVRCSLSECQRWFTFETDDIRASSYPFCSPLCKGADLGNWVNEDYKVPSLPDLRGLDDEDDEG
jgi:endogenous inhibitor of DNA gyrase (YacG/DUF329 family)